ncbi:MAG: hypothetical protein KIT11_11005 [Fimbriimonadaceae bacterium]|nr:hypothetical protein [Fimbriimonadaceae bacterium]QYK55849.1 MAG: hypothetical protein KF733_12675 [Fimbriimonadaceae bacterium]
MRLRIATTTFLVAGILLMIGWPFIVGPAPRRDAPRSVQVAWGKRALAYFGVTSTVWLVTAACALGVIRQRRREIVEEQRRNLRELVEGSLRDHDGS